MPSQRTVGQLVLARPAHPAPVVGCAAVSAGGQLGKGAIAPSALQAAARTTVRRREGASGCLRALLVSFDSIASSPGHGPPQSAQPVGAGVSSNHDLVAHVAAPARLGAATWTRPGPAEASRGMSGRGSLPLRTESQLSSTSCNKLTYEADLRQLHQAGGAWLAAVSFRGSAEANAPVPGFSR